MIVTIPGKDLIVVTDSELENWTSAEPFDRKIHLIKLNLSDPTKDKMDSVLFKYPYTNRFIITDNIKFYNWFFRSHEKKYYVQNGNNTKLISFFKKNNKVLLNFNNLDFISKQFALRNGVFKDILKNLEIIQIDEATFEEKKDILSNWSGNVVID